MLYRVHQFIHAIFPHINASELSWALNNVPQQGCSLFLKQSSSEQRHAIDVAQSLKIEKSSLTLSDFQTLIAAALLHDCGKSNVDTRLWHRVFIVLMQKMPNSILSCLESSHTVFSTPLQIASQHALWGSNLAQSAGLNPVICQLIREHHSPTTDLGRILANADNKH